jgi:hydrogenase maturation protease
VRVVVGIGNPTRGDDGAGRAVARRLRARQPRGIEVRECDGEATGLMAAWEGAEEVVLVDACRGAGPPGSIHDFDATEIEGSASRPLRHGSTHSFGVAAAIGLARALVCLPPHLVLYGIEGRSFGEGAGLSPEAERAVDEVVTLLIRRFPGAEPGPDDTSCESQPRGCRGRGATARSSRRRGRPHRRRRPRPARA